uniref:Cytochrome P450 33D3 n=1 Tax=Bursaphelenchus xylophilus TaxID=6326 RepID=A0A1I7RJ52_BURXY
MRSNCSLGGGKVVSALGNARLSTEMNCGHFFLPYTEETLFEFTMALFLIVVVVISAIYLLNNFHFKRQNLPPGPAPLPIIGNLHCIDPADTYKAFLHWKKQYGPVFTCWFGNIPAVCFTDYEVLTEALIKNGDVFGSRFAYGRMTELVRGGHENVGLLDEGRPEIYQEQRRFFTNFIRSLTADGAKLEDRIFFEVSQFIQELDVACDNRQSIEFVPLIDRSVGSIISSLIFGTRYEKDQVSEFLYLKETINQFLVYISDPLALSVANHRFNFTVFPPFRERYKRIERTRNKLFAFMNAKVDQHENEFENLNNNEEYKCLIDAFLFKIKNDVNPAVYNRKMLVNMMFDLFSAGQDTTSHTIAFILLYILNSPQTQRRIHEELDRTIGSGRRVTNLDRQNLTYLNAVICEGQRLANLIPINLFQRNLSDVTIAGHKIPAGSCILPQIACVMFDEKVFPDPFEFKPDRFLAEDGSLKRFVELIPFSLGKRQCLGENIARMELFLFISNMFNQFVVHPMDEASPPTTKKVLGMTAQPQPFQVRLSRRWPNGIEAFI